MGKFSHQSQILRRIANSHSQIIFAKCYVENPMQRVLYTPMTTNDLISLVGVGHQARNIVSLLYADLIVNSSRRLHHNQALEIAPPLFMSQPFRRLDAVDPPRFEPTMTSLGCFDHPIRFNSACVLPLFLFLLRHAFGLKDPFHFSPQMGLIILERQHIIGLLLANLLSNILRSEEHTSELQSR